MLTGDPWAPAVLVAAFFLDYLAGDPVGLPHPVRLIGRLIGFLEKLLYWDSAAPGRQLLAGALLATVTIGLVGMGSYFLLEGLEQVAFWPSRVLEVLLLASTICPRDLARGGQRVYQALVAGRLDDARQEVAGLVSRDTRHLDEAEVCRATVETVAENTVDGVIAPLCYFVLGGVPLALAYRTINTLDSMVGYRNARYLYFGRVAARLDDAANYLPARVGGLLLIAAAWLLGHNARDAWQVWRRDARHHPSPNAGVPEGVVAGALGICLGGRNFYRGRPEWRPYLGVPAGRVAAVHITRTVALMYLAAWLAVLGSLVIWAVALKLEVGG